MDTAVAANSPIPLVPADSFAARVAALPARSKLMLGAGAAALVAVVTALTLWSGQGDYKVLYANLSDKDGGAIIAQLSQMNVPYKHADGGAAILVPAASVHDVRLKLASAGLPKGSVVGFELLDNAKFGQTQFQERLSFQRGLEGELTRSITAMNAVESARVHLALPNQNGFFREQQKPSASVLLTLRPGRTLDRAQIAGIVHLISSSVPEMNPKAVSVLDQTGALLSAPEGAEQGAGLDAQQLQYVNQIESGYTKRILELLEPVVGRENLRASVTAEIDFSQTEATFEEFKPNQGAGRQCRGAQPADDRAGRRRRSLPTGVPGAASNVPPVTPTAPINGAAQPLQAAGGTAGRQQPARRGDQLRSRQDGARDAQRDRQRQARQRRGGGQPPQRPRRQGQADVGRAQRRRDRQADRAGAGERRLQPGARRLGSGRQCAVPGRIGREGRHPVVEATRGARALRLAGIPAALAFVALLVIFGLLRPAMKAAMRAGAGAGRAHARCGRRRRTGPAGAAGTRRDARPRGAADGRAAGPGAQHGEGEPGRSRPHRARLGQR